jgi:galactose-1-phosphate uridylyltransferase
VVEDNFLARPPPLVEIVHVELADERIHVGMLKVGWEDDFFEFTSGNYFKAHAVFAPCDRTSMLITGTNFKQLLEES